MAVDQRVLALIAAQKTSLTSITDAQARALLVAWARAWDEISVALDRAVAELVDAARDGRPTVHRQITARQAARSLQRASEQLEALILATGVAATTDVWEMVRRGMADADAVTRLQLPVQLRTTVLRVDARQLDAIVQRTTEQITARHIWLAADAQDAMKRELVRTLAVGDNPRVAARRMMDRAHSVFNGGRNRALTIARTEQLDAYRDASRRHNLANRDVLQGWRWIADLSDRTCRSCLAMHGTDHPIQEAGPIDHHQGRCTRVPITKSWADLGVDADEPPDATPNAADWFEQQPEQVQRDILTNRGYEAWRAGDYPMSDWSARRSTPGWRDSRTPSRPPLSPADGS